MVTAALARRVHVVKLPGSIVARSEPCGGATGIPKALAIREKPAPNELVSFGTPSSVPQVHTSHQWSSDNGPHSAYGGQ